ncbi:MAG: hypothetical protein ACMUJM_01575 [bacterium]
MGKDKKNKIVGIPPEKMAILAEKGLKAAKLTDEEKHYLLHGGLKELYDIWEFQRQTIPPLEPETIDAIIERHFPSLYEDQYSKEPERAPLLIILRNLRERIKVPPSWQLGSPVFAHRGEEKINECSLLKKVGKLTVHLQIVGRDERSADINARLTGDAGKDQSFFEVELLKGERCVESVRTTLGNTISLSAVAIGNYILRISDSGHVITSIAIKMVE